MRDNIFEGQNCPGWGFPRFLHEDRKNETKLRAKRSKFRGVPGRSSLVTTFHEHPSRCVHCNISCHASLQRPRPIAKMDQQDPAPPPVVIREHIIPFLTHCPSQLAAEMNVTQFEGCDCFYRFRKNIPIHRAVEKN